MDFPKIHGFKKNSKSLDKAKSKAKTGLSFLTHLKNTLQDNIKS